MRYFSGYARYVTAVTDPSSGELRLRGNRSGARPY
jgi:hypothetical protein